ncbi:hypothetical protein [Alteromonas sp. RKMC-009]|uniref:hypothetical protein n=1 Tax=Alteromonas sp. RKMC-009 TaxID=2267264 RepID=UPI000E69FDE1|nr:hypothetical protein [Alteromonas sp. RKMC-009]AYA64299.1 hypothetical protein DS731_09990 [Alteromonas sp. RKMC-009]
MFKLKMKIIWLTLRSLLGDHAHSQSYSSNPYKRKQSIGKTDSKGNYEVVTYVCVKAEDR